MTKRQKEKQSRHNAEKTAETLYRKKANGTYLTEADYLRVQADLRRQEDEINARIRQAAEQIERDQNLLNKKWNKWCEWFCHYTVPRICVGFYYATLQASKIYLIKSAREDFMDKISEEMQKVLDYMTDGDDVDLDKFQHYADLLDKEGYAVPEWAQKEDLLLDDDPEAEYDNPEVATLKRQIEQLQEENRILKAERPYWN